MTAISKPAPAEDVPAIIAVVLDTSRGVAAERLQEAVDLARGVLDSLPAHSELALFTIDDTPRRVLERTSDAERIVAALESVQRSGRRPALHDALYDASVYLRETPTARKAILLVTNGGDEGSAVRLEDAIAAARASGIPVFAIGVGRAHENVLRRVAKLTAGRYSRLEEASGFEIASLILETRPAAGPAHADSGGDAPAGSEAARPASTGAHGEASWLAGGALALVLTLSVAALVLVGWFGLRRRAGRGARLHPSEPDEGATVLVRSPEIAPVARTVLLARRPALAVVEGPRSGARFSLTETGAVSLGRSPGNDIILDDEAVSGEHCRVRPEEGHFVLHDLDSTNGTFVNGRRVSRHTLQPGDSIRIGASRLEYRLD